MKILLISLCFFLTQGFTDYIIHDCKENRLKIEIAKIHKHKVNVTQGGHQDFFTIMHPDSSVKYLINIIRTKAPMAYDYLTSAEYKNSFSDSTSTIEEVKEIDYKSFKGVRFLKKIRTSQRVFLSYTISTVVGGDLLVITYNTIESNFLKYETEFDYSVNSIQLK